MESREDLFLAGLKPREGVFTSKTHGNMIRVYAEVRKEVISVERPIDPWLTPQEQSELQHEMYLELREKALAWYRRDEEGRLGFGFVR